MSAKSSAKLCPKCGRPYDQKSLVHSAYDQQHKGKPRVWQYAHYVSDERIAGARRVNMCFQRMGGGV